MAGISQDSTKATTGDRGRLTVHVEALGALASSFEEENISLKQKVAKLTDENQRLKEAVHDGKGDREQQVSELQKINQQLALNHSKLKEEQQIQFREIEFLRSKLVQSEGIVRSLQQRNQVLEEQLAANQGGGNESRQRVRQLEDELAYMKQQVQARRKDFETERQDKERAVREKQSDAWRYAVEITSVKQQLEHCRAEFSQYVQEATRQAEQLKITNQYLEDQCRKHFERKGYVPCSGSGGAGLFALDQFTPVTPNILQSHDRSHTNETPSLPQAYPPVPSHNHMSLFQNQAQHPTTPHSQYIHHQYSPSPRSHIPPMTPSRTTGNTCSTAHNTNPAPPSYMSYQRSENRVGQYHMATPGYSGASQPNFSLSDILTTPNAPPNRNLSFQVNYQQRSINMHSNGTEQDNTSFYRELASFQPLEALPRPSSLPTTFGAVLEITTNSTNSRKRQTTSSFTPPPCKKRHSMVGSSPAANSELGEDSGFEASPIISFGTSSFEASPILGMGTQAVEASPILAFGTPSSSIYSDTDRQIDGIASSVEVGLDLDKLDKTCAEQHLLPIAKMLEHYSSYGPHLDLSETELNAIETDTKLTAPHQKPLEMLQRWHRKSAYTDKGTYRHLLRGCIEINSDRKLVGEICKLLK